MILNFWLFKARRPKLGQLSKIEKALAKERVAKAKAMPNRPQNCKHLYEVAVAVFVNGRLQFHGGETVAVSANTLPRSVMREAVCHIVPDIDPHGDCETEAL